MKRLNKYYTTIVLTAGLMAAAAPLSALPPPADAEVVLADAYKGKSYSPYAGRGFASRPLWGDSHLHTALSMDAGAFGNRLGLDAAYRFARGEEVVSSNGTPARLSRPLDWLVIADHSDNMGFFPDLLAGKPQMLADPTGKDWYERIKSGDGVSVALEIISKFSQGEFPEALAYTPDSTAYKSVWQETIDAAEKYNDPGKFTALIGFEWTSLVKGANMHRVVIYRDNADKASQLVAYTTTPPLGSINPRDLWKWMENYEEKTGGDVLAIAHNGNLSNGIMFPLQAQYDGTAFDDTYVTQRNRWEPLYEATQIKGDGETHPLLSPDDEFADYETWDVGNLDLSAAKTDGMLAGEYSREALKRGLEIEALLGTNPYKFGQIGSTDSHTSLATAQEDNFFGKHTGYEPSPTRMDHPMMKSDQGVIEGWQTAASGLAAVWAPENTRESIFDAMARKEVYATTGSRMGVRNLDRIQIIKGWLDADGKTHEKVYDVKWSGDRKPGKDGKLPAVGARCGPIRTSIPNKRHSIMPA
jgi:hypothetical protein